MGAMHMAALNVIDLELMYGMKGKGTGVKSRRTHQQPVNRCKNIIA
jgi:hypothetical protein